MLEPFKVIGAVRSEAAVDGVGLAREQGDVAVDAEPAALAAGSTKVPRPGRRNGRPSWPVAPEHHRAAIHVELPAVLDRRARFEAERADARPDIAPRLALDAAVA